MSEAPATRSDNPIFIPGVRDYMFLGLAAALVLFLGLAFLSSLVPALLISLLAAAGIMLRFVIAPGLVILLTGYFLADPFLLLLSGSRSVAWRPENNSLEYTFALADLVIVMALLVYLLAQFRVLAFTRNAIPEFTRPRARRVGDKRPSARRPAEHVHESEFTFGILAAFLALIAGQLLTLLVFALGPEEPEFGLYGRERFDRLALYVWILVVSATLLTAAAAYIRVRRMTGEQARRFLENTAWNETQREQSRLQRWRVWLRWWEGRR